MKQLTQACLWEAIRAYPFAGEVVSALPYGEGHVNDTFLVTLRDGTQYILQRINTNTFKNPAALMDNICAVTAFQRDAVAARGGDTKREAMTVVPASSGASFVTDADGGAWRVYVFVTDSICLQRVESAADFATAAAAFGGFARMLADYPAATLHETIVDFHHTPKRYDAFERAVAEDVCGRAHEMQSEIAFVRARKADCAVLVDQLTQGLLPLRVTHNDTKLNNVLIDARTGRGMCVIDLDTVMPGLLAYDFGDSIRFGANDCTEDEPDQSKVHFSMPLYKTYAEAYLAAVGDMLTEDERVSLAWGARLMTLECGIRFLTDYLQGDVYFKTHRPGHNVDRARTQFTLVKQMEEYFDEMMDVVK